MNVTQEGGINAFPWDFIIFCPVFPATPLIFIKANIHMNKTSFFRIGEELLNVFLQNQVYFKSGLCQWSETLFSNGKITYQELIYILSVIRERKPFIAKLLGKAYYWKIGEINPRIKFLKKHLK